MAYLGLGQDDLAATYRAQRAARVRRQMNAAAEAEAEARKKAAGGEILPPVSLPPIALPDIRPVDPTYVKWGVYLGAGLLAVVAYRVWKGTK